MPWYYESNSFLYNHLSYHLSFSSLIAFECFYSFPFFSYGPTRKFVRRHRGVKILVSIHFLTKALTTGLATLKRLAVLRCSSELSRLDITITTKVLWQCFLHGTFVISRYSPTFWLTKNERKKREAKTWAENYKDARALIPCFPSSPSNPLTKSTEVVFLSVQYIPCFLKKRSLPLAMFSRQAASLTSILFFITLPYSFGR